MQRYIVRTNWDRVDYGGGIFTCLFFFIILPIFIWSPLLWWLWLFILIPPIGWGSGRVYYKYAPVNTVKTVTTYNPLNEPINEPRSPQEGSEPSGVSIEMKELKF